MKITIDHLLKKNVDWSRRMTDHDPEFFRKLVNQQAPEFLWIGCSDSRVPANEIVDLMPGELFVHRNVGNIVYTADLNCQSVIEFAVNVLRVRHIIICGHYGCGGVQAALDHQHHGLIDHWLTSIKDVYQRHQKEVDALPDSTSRLDRMCELNVIAQVNTLAQTPVAQRAWRRGQDLSLYGWVYSLEDGLIKDLDVRVSGLDAVHPTYRYTD